MHVRRPRSVSRSAVGLRAAVDPLERRVMFDAAVRTVSLLNQLGYGTNPATDVAVDVYGDVYATRTGGDGTSDTQLVVIPAGGDTPQVLTTFASLTEYTNTVERPYGQLVLDSAGDVFGVARYNTTGAVPFGEDATQGLLWELPAHFGVIDVLARFTKPESMPQSLTVDGKGNLYGTITSLLGGSSVFEYPADETGVVTVSLGAGSYSSAIVADNAGDVFGTVSATDDPAGPFSLFEVKKGTHAPTILAAVPASMGYDVAGLTIDGSGNLFVTTQLGPNGGTLLELPAGGHSVRLLPGGSGQPFNGKPYVDGSGNVYVTAGDPAAGTSVLLELPAGGSALQTVTTFATGDTSDVAMDALGNLYGTYTDTTTGQATVYAVPTRTITTPTPTPTPTTPSPTSTVTGLAPMVLSSSIPTTVVGGTKGNRSVTVSLTNTGAAAEVGTATVAVYAAPTGSAVTSGTLLKSAAHGVKLAAGGGTSWVVRVPPTGLSPGTYTLLAVATDTTGTAIASSAGPTFTVVAATVSLGVTVTITPSTAAVGGWVTLAAALTNAGTAGSTGQLTATFGLSLDGVAVTLGTVVRRGTTVRAGGKPVTLRLRVRLPATTAAGSYLPTVAVAQGKATATATGTMPVSVSAG